MKTLVTGGFGFIGSNLITNLLNSGKEVVCVDNFSTGSARFLTKNEAQNIQLIEVDLSKISVEYLEKMVGSIDTVFHIAANADVRSGWSDSFRDIEQNIIATYKIAEVARRKEVSEFVFTSTGCVYGDSTVMPTPETHPFPIQTSLYGSSKVACEGILSAYTANGAFKTTVFRFVSVLGRNYHHGHVIDFIRKLRANPEKLKILGNGKQKKSYINVSDCITALILLRGPSNFEVFNIGHVEYLNVLQSATLISSRLNLSPEFSVEKKERGWIGDNPFTFLDISKALASNWRPTIGIMDSICETVDWIIDNDWILDKPDFRLT